MAFQTEPLMEIVGRKIAADFEQGRNGPLVILFTHKGDIHYVDLVSGEIKWTRETGNVIYQAYQAPGVTRYVDIGAEDESPSYYQPGSGPTKVIPGETAGEMSKWIKFLCKEDATATVSTNEDDEYRINHLTGKDDAVVGPDTLLIKRTNWDIQSTDQHWFVRYTNMVASFPSNGLKCLVFYARTAERFMELSKKFALVKVPGGGILARIYNSSKRIRLANPLDKFVESKGYILHLHGYLENDGVNEEVFLKKVPKMEKFLRTKHVYTKFGRFRYVIRQLMVESDDNYEYIAFEKMEGTLADHVKRIIDKDSLDLKVLRNVVEALLELHGGDVLHRNICPENVLLTTGTRGDYIVKLCGLGSSIKCPRGVMGSSWYMLERHKLARLILNYMTLGTHSFKDNDIPSDYELQPFTKAKIKSEYGDALIEAGAIAADLVEKLMLPSNRLTLLMVYHHVLFWNDYDKISFLKDVSDEMFAGSLPDMEYLAGEVFKDEWEVPEESRVIEAYNHVLTHGKETKVYRQYCPWS